MITENNNDQFFLKLKSKYIYDKSNFLVSTSNKNAFKLINNWPNWKSRKLIIIGQKGAGKTHLSKIWKKKAKAVSVNIKNYKKKSYDILFRKKKNFVIEDINTAISVFRKKEKLEVEKYLLHFYNLIEEKKCYVILTDPIPPKFWNIMLPDLRSRILSSLCVEINQPDDELLSLLLVKLFSDKQILIDKKIIKFIVSRSERSFENLQSIVEKIDRRSLITKKKINLNFIKELI